MLLSRRLSAILLTLVFLTGNLAVCAGWAATPEARMACCASEAGCPMHASDSPQAGEQHTEQAEADTCCALSQPEAPGPSTLTVVHGVSLAILGYTSLLPAPASAPALRETWRTVVPATSSAVRRHVLLSVFLL